MSILPLEDFGLAVFEPQDFETGLLCVQLLLRLVCAWALHLHLVDVDLDTMGSTKPHDRLDHGARDLALVDHRLGIMRMIDE